MMPTKTRPLARFGYLAFAPFSIFSCNSGSSLAITAPSGTPTAQHQILISKAPFRCDQFR